MLITHKISWDKLSRNPNAIKLLEENQDKIDWEYLSGNLKAIHLLEQNPNLICWYKLSTNPNAIHLLEQNWGKINWIKLIFRHAYLYHHFHPKEIYELNLRKTFFLWKYLYPKENHKHI